MFAKMVVLGPTRFTADTKTAFAQCAREILYVTSIPMDDAALIQRIGDADALLVALQVQVRAPVILACPSLRYIGMCCSLYGPESANVDILAANARGIAVSGIRDYGDEGVVEYVISELVQLLHGFREHLWRHEPTELTGISVGILGMGTLGRLISEALQFFGARVCYYSRTRKMDIEKKGVAYAPLNALLADADICIGCLNKNAILLQEEQFEAFGHGKILMNIAIGPCAAHDPLCKWLAHRENFFLCDTPSAVGYTDLLHLPNVLVVRRGAGDSIQSNRRYNEKILANVRKYLREHDSCASY